MWQCRFLLLFLWGFFVCLFFGLLSSLGIVKSYKERCPASSARVSFTPSQSALLENNGCLCSCPGFLGHKEAG